MYTKPTLERFGSFRELTMVGVGGTNDIHIITGPPNPGCNPGQSVVNSCPSTS